MGFFTALFPLLKRGALTIRIADAGDGKVKLLILQDPPKEGEESVPLPPLRHVDAPQELDGKLEDELTQLAAYREGPVQSVLDQAKAEMDEAAAEEKRRSAERLATARKKPSAAKPTTPPSKPASPPSATAEEDDADDDKAGGRESEAAHVAQTDLFA